MYYMCDVSCAVGVLLPELATCLVLLQQRVPAVMHASACMPMLHALLDILDKFNRLAPGLQRDDYEDLSWPGIWGESHTRTFSRMQY